MSANSPRKLPVELVREVFTIAARSNRAAATAFLRVAKAVHEWIEPIIWEEATLITHEKENAFLEALKARSALGRYVRHVLFLCTSDSEICEDVLLACKNIESLSCSSAAEPSLVAALPLKRFTTTDASHFFQAAFDEDNGARFRKSLTHVCVTDLSPYDWNDDTDEGLSDLDLFPSLTHLMLFLDLGNVDVESDWDPELIFGTLVPSLKVLIIVLENRDALEKDEVEWYDRILRHPSIVLMDEYLENVDLDKDWKAFVNGEPDYWEKAEKILASRSGQGPEDAYVYGPGMIGTIELVNLEGGNEDEDEETTCCRIRGLGPNQVRYLVM